MKAHGGKTIGGATVGILMLSSRFPRILGDGGNIQTWPFPMLCKVIDDATPERVVLGRAEGLLTAFVAGAQELVAAGADGITTNCGFLIGYQRELTHACGVPVATSSLLQVPWVQTLLPPGRRVGVLTISPTSLEPALLRAAGASEDTPIGGPDADSELARVILGDALELDVDRARSEMHTAGTALIDAHPEVGALVLECTNMSPYSSTLARHLRVPVFDFYSFVCWFQAGIRPRAF